MTREVPERHPGLTVAALLEHTDSLGTLAELFHLSRRTLHRYARTGLTIDQADGFAQVLGMHPTQLWPAWLAIDAARKARRERIRYHSNPRRREQAITAARHYYGQYADHLNAGRRRRYAANAEQERAKRRDRYARSREAQVD